MWCCCNRFVIPYRWYLIDNYLKIHISIQENNYCLSLVHVMADDTKPLPEPMLTKICHHMSSPGHNELSYKSIQWHVRGDPSEQTRLTHTAILSTQYEDDRTQKTTITPKLHDHVIPWEPTLIFCVEKLPLKRHIHSVITLSWNVWEIPWKTILSFRCREAAIEGEFPHRQSTVLTCRESLIVSHYNLLCGEVAS